MDPKIIVEDWILRPFQRARPQKADSELKLTKLKGFVRRLLGNARVLWFLSYCFHEPTDGLSVFAKPLQRLADPEAAFPLEWGDHECPLEETYSLPQAASCEPSRRSGLWFAINKDVTAHEPKSPFVKGVVFIGLGFRNFDLHGQGRLTDRA